jgi:hypothetical protein
MNLQQERIDGHCQSLKLEGLMQRYVALASDAATKQWSFLDFLENALAHEREMRQVSRGGVKEPGMGGVMAPAEPGVKRGFERFQGCGFLPFLATAF